jgi:hypothetical protein
MLIMTVTFHIHFIWQVPQTCINALAPSWLHRGAKFHTVRRMPCHTETPVLTPPQYSCLCRSSQPKPHNASQQYQARNVKLLRITTCWAYWNAIILLFNPSGLRWMPTIFKYKHQGLTSSGNLFLRWALLWWDASAPTGDILLFVIRLYYGGVDLLQQRNPFFLSFSFLLWWVHVLLQAL